jgi:hypothetical protein
VVAYVRTVKTSSGATAVQIVRSSRRGSRRIEHLGSAHDETELEALKAAAVQRLAEGQQVLDLGLADTGSGDAPLQIISSQTSHLWDGLCRAYGVLGFDRVLDGDEVLRDLVLARIIEPTSKIDAERMLTETGVAAASYRTVKRRLPVIAKPAVRQAYQRPALLTPGWGQPAWCCSMCPPCTSKPMPVTGFVSRGSRRNAAWSRRSPWAC